MDTANIQYATAKDWQDIMRNRSRLRMHELIERLGLRAKWSSNKRGKTNFESDLVKTLVADMSDIVTTLPKETTELIQYLSDPGSLREEVRGLLNKHGSAIWGRLSSREHLLTAGSPDADQEFYPRDIYYENEEDRKLIQVLLHWWIGLKACNVIHARERLDREKKKKKESMKAMADLENPQDTAPRTFAALAPNPDTPAAPASKTSASIHFLPPTEASRHAQVSQFDSASRGSPTSSTILTPPWSNESLAASARSNINGNAAHSTTSTTVGSQAIPAGNITNAQSNNTASRDKNGSQHIDTFSQPALRQLSLELGSLVSNFLVDDRGNPTGCARETASPMTPNSAGGDIAGNGARGRGLDMDTLRGLRAYVYRDENGAAWDEDSLLRRLETAWRDQIRTGHNGMLENTPLFVARDRAFLTWIELRRHLADLDRADRRWRDEGSSAHEMEIRIQEHSTLMSASRELIRNWEEIGQGLDIAWAPNLSADKLLVQAFALLAGDSTTPDMVWEPVDVMGVIRWLADNLQRFATEEDGQQQSLLYVGK